MPEEIQNTPLNTKLVEAFPPAAGLGNILRNPRLDEELSYDEIRHRIKSFLGAEHKKNPNIPRERLNLLFSTYFGPFMLEPPTHMSIAETAQQKELSARIQHQLCHSFLFASSSKSSPEYAQNMFDLAKKLQWLSVQSELGISNKLGAFWNGIRAETALIHALLDYDFRVAIPDYTKFGSTQDNEVLRWDVESGIDLIALSDETQTAFLIDAKGRYKSQIIGINDHITVDQYPLTPEEITKLPPSLKRALGNSVHIRRAKITLPTSSKFLGKGGFSQLSPHKDYKQALKEAFSLDGDLAYDIFEKLNNPADFAHEVESASDKVLVKI